MAIGNLGKIGGNKVYAQMNQDKLQMFVERYLELSNELKYRKGESGAYMQLGEILTKKGDYDSSTKHFYRAMKIAEENGDNDMKDVAKVNFGMANASMKWNAHVTDILRKVQGESDETQKYEDEDNDIQENDEDEEEDSNNKLPDIN